MTDRPFWETKSLSEMSRDEWELICDGCAKCCLVKIEDEDSGDIAFTRLHCRLLDAEICRCKDYENRQAYVPDCVKLTPGNVEQLKWMPKECSYRRLADGRGLEAWHHLISGDRGLIHKLGHSIKGKTVDETDAKEDEWMHWIVDWEGNTP